MFSAIEENVSFCTATLLSVFLAIVKLKMNFINCFVFVFTECCFVFVLKECIILL
jgi:Ca2+/Na+ antiporter